MTVAVVLIGAAGVIAFTHPTANSSIAPQACSHTSQIGVPPSLLTPDSSVLLPECSEYNISEYGTINFSVNSSIDSSGE
jgi:hypothetical protein